MKRNLIFLVIALSFYSLILSQVTDSLEEPKNMTVAQFNLRTTMKNKLILVNFAADWCVMCKKQKPILNEIKREKKDVLDIIVIDMDDNPLIAEHFNVDGLPINLMYKNGELVWDRPGLKTKSELLRQISYFEESPKK